MSDRQTVISAFELIRKHGFAEAERLSAKWRDSNAPGTMSFALHNATWKQVREFAAGGSMYRPIGLTKSDAGHPDNVIL